METVGRRGRSRRTRMALPVGVARIEHFSWKAILDFYTCTECGRCSDNCPAHRTGKVLSPKHLTLALRDHLYGREDELIAHRGANGAAKPAPAEGASPDAAPADGAAASAASTDGAAASNGIQAINLVPDVVHPDVLWACTSCRACEEQCPVLISYVDKIIDMRRNLVMVKGEFPHELAKPVPGHGDQRQPVEPVAHGPRRRGPTDSASPRWPRTRRRRSSTGWAARRATTTARRRSREPRRGSSSRRASTSRSSGRKRAAPGDPARRAGNEFLFAMLAEGNAAHHQRLQGAGRRAHDRHDVPALLQLAEERVPRLRPQGRGRAPHGLPPRPRGRGQARADQARRRGASSTTTRATSAATTACTTRRARS